MSSVGVVTAPGIVLVKQLAIMAELVMMSPSLGLLFF
jgi:hypothetical protein